MKTTNVCIDCQAEFEVLPGLWLKCKSCKKRAEDVISIALERLLAQFEPIPDLADMMPETKAARRRLLGDVYATL